MSKKSPKIASLIEDCQGKSHPAHYLAYFKCFNSQFYYESHDVLEELWLQDRNSPDYGYFKALIQAAGGFVHLKLQGQSPEHHVHGKRLYPAAKLFRLALKNLEPYGSLYMDFNLDEFRVLINGYLKALESSDFQINPYHQESPPQIALAE